MDDWLTMATDNWGAARDLFIAQRWRSAMSRAYYCVFGRATAALIGSGMTLPLGRESWSHKAVPNMVLEHLERLNLQERQRLFGMIVTLYSLRIIADHVPSSAVGEDEARSAGALMIQAVQLLREANGGTHT